MVPSRFALIGAASGWGAQIYSTEQGPAFMQTFLAAARLSSQEQGYAFTHMLSSSVRAAALTDPDLHSKINLIAAFDQQLANVTAHCVKQGQCPVVIGGDHSVALGTWGGVISALQAQKEFGLLWIDAHMDSHTLETTPSKAVHGMPVACLLGYGEPALVNIALEGAKIKPEHLVLLGVRSFEQEEAELLRRLNVRIYFMEEINQRGFAVVFKEAISQITLHTKGFGVSIDLDAFDPLFAPGVGSPVADGLNPREVLAEISSLHHPLFKALEIAEFNPVLDHEDKTATLIKDILTTFGREVAQG